MSREHAIILLDVVEKTLGSWTVLAHKLAHMLALIREAKGNLEAQAKGHANECAVGIKLRDSVADELELTLRALRCSRARVAELEAKERWTEQAEEDIDAARNLFVAAGASESYDGGNSMSRLPDCARAIIAERDAAAARVAELELERDTTSATTRAARVTELEQLAQVQVVDNAGVCRFLACLRESVTRDGYVLSYAAVADGSYADRAHAIGGVWTTKELRAAILAALPA